QQPLRVIVLDAAGHPVRRAAVTFRVTASDSRLFDANGGGNAVVTVATDARGHAEAPLQLAEQQGTDGHFVLLAPEDPAPQWIGHATVEVSVATTSGTLASGEALIADILPAAPEQVKLARSNIGSIYFGAGYDRYAALVTDAFDNPVANVPVEISLSNDTSAAQCLDSPAFGPVIGAGLFAAFGNGGCPADELRLTGHPCTTPGPLQVRTLSDGRAPFHVAAPSHPSMIYDVHVSAAGASVTGQGHANPVDTCRSFAATFTASSVGYNSEGQAARGARLGEVIASPYLFTALVGIIEDGGSPHGTIWQPLTGGRLNTKGTPLQNGSLDSWHEASPGNYEFRLRAGTAPGDIHGRIVLQGNFPPPASQGEYRLDVHGVYDETNDDYSYGWAVDLRPPSVTPDRIPLTAFGTTADDFVLRSQFDPPQWQPGVNALELSADGEFVNGCTFANRDYGAECSIRRGLQVESGKHYTAKTVLENEFVRLESEPVEVHFQQGIIAGYGIIEAAASTAPNAPRPSAPKDESDLLGLLRGNFPTSLSVRQDVDVATGYVCDAPAQLGYVLSQPARVQIRFFLLDRDGNRTDREIWPHPAQDLPVGVHTLDISPGELPIGSYVYRIEALANGDTDVREGVISSRRERHDVLPLAHDFVKGVDLYSGGLVLSQDDIAVGGRGPGLRLTRTYASHAGDRSGFFGRGWSADLDMQVVANGCGSRT
ncbi:MAG TPA: DUF6531 domain-containing protein, partial [Tahibacter sp.]|nr:DUF6531 domain-containing protein [Tahibacter sp.]